MDFILEKGVPISRPKSSKEQKKYPFKEMQVGDSFLTEKYSAKAMRKINTAAYHYRDKHTEPKPKFAIRKTEDGMMRIWRVV